MRTVGGGRIDLPIPLLRKVRTWSGWQPAQVSSPASAAATASATHSPKLRQRYMDRTHYLACDRSEGGSCTLLGEVLYAASLATASLRFVSARPERAARSRSASGSDAGWRGG